MRASARGRTSTVPAARPEERAACAFQKSAARTMSEPQSTYEQRLQSLSKHELMFEWMSKMEQVALAQAEMVARVDKTCNPSLQPEYTVGCPEEYGVQYQATLDALEKEKAAIEALVKQAATAKILWQAKVKEKIDLKRDKEHAQWRRSMLLMPEHEEDPDSLSTNVDGTVYR